jgi:nicotinamidase-related amidase
MPSPSAPFPADTLLLCVDMQPVFVDVVAGGHTVQRRCEFAVAAAAGLGLPVAFTEQVPEKLGATVPALRALAPQAPVWSKQTFSALADEGIAGALQERGVRQLLLGGVETPVCVYQTAIGALARRLEVTVLSDCVGARRPDDAAACLAELARLGAHLLPAETVFYALIGSPVHPFFRAYTRLVKAYHAAATGAAPAAPRSHA